MRNLIFLLVVPFTFFQSFGQDEVYLSFSQTFSSFNYTNSEIEKDVFVDSDVKAGSSIGYYINSPSWMDLRLDLSLLNMGARAAYDSESVKWDLNYINANVNFGYRYKKTNLQPYVLLGPYLSYLYKASQEIGTTFYNLIELKKMKRIDLGVNILYGVNLKVSSSVFLFLEARHSIGLYQIENDVNNQKLYNRAFSIALGIKTTCE